MRFFLPVLILACCIAGGCDVRTKVSGKVTYPDGSPVPIGEVKGYADGIHIRAVIDKDGTFDMYEVTPGDLIPAGKTYEISIVNAEVAPTLNLKPGQALPAQLPQAVVYVDPKYSDGASSGLVLEVPKSKEPVVYNIEVTKPQ